METERRAAEVGVSLTAGECLLVTCSICHTPKEITNCVSIRNKNYPDTPPAIVCVACARKRK